MKCESGNSKIESKTSCRESKTSSSSSRARRAATFLDRSGLYENHQGAKRVDLQLKRSPNSARRELAAPPILFSGFEIAPSFEVSEEGGLHGTPTEAFLS